MRDNSVTIGALVRTEIGFMTAEARIVPREGLLHIVTAALGHVLSVAKALLAHLVGPSAEGLVFLASPRQESADQQTGCQTHDANHHGVLGHIMLEASLGTAERSRGAL